LWVNENALSTTQISSIANPVAGPNPFQVHPVSLPTSPATQSSYLPAFEVTLGEMSDSSAYFYVDWTSEKTVAWPKTCKQSDMTTPCSAAPLLMQCSYNQKNTSFAIVDTIELSGYTINQYFTQKDLVCFGSNCI
jgi:hypothetical protein